MWDTGPGIAPEQRTVIFEEFRRLGTPEADAPAGLGLGLAIVDRIGRMLDHPIALRSWPGQGSVFSVSLPLGTAAPAPPVAAVSRRIPNTLAGKVALCLDNDRSVLAAMRILLEGWSCTVLTGADLASARRELARRQAMPDIILIDYHLDGSDTGLTVLDALATEFGRVPGILITANYTDGLRLAAQASGYPLLNKPLRPAALRALMAQLLAPGAGYEKNVPLTLPSPPMGERVE